MQRQMVSMPKMIYELINRLKNGYRELAYDTLFRAMFDNKEIKYDDLPDEVINVLIVAKYELKKIKSKYENGRVEKTKSNDPIFASKNSRSETKRNEANLSENSASDYYNKIQNNINYIYNIINQSNNKINNSYIIITNKDIMVKSMQKISQENKKEYETLLEVFRKICSEKEIKINGVAHTQAVVLDKISGLLINQERVQQLLLKISEVEQTEGLRNKINYLTSALFNLCKTLESNKSITNNFQKSKNQTPAGFMTREYTSEYLNSLTDSLDNVEL